MNTPNYLSNSIIKLLDQKLKQNNPDLSLNNILQNKQGLPPIVKEFINNFLK